MKPLYTDENRAKVEAFFADEDFRRIVENECGHPIKVKVLWEKGVVRVQGPNSGRDVHIKDILGAQHLN